MITSAGSAAHTHRWRLAPTVPAELAAALPELHPVLLRALYRRGLRDPAAARAFLRHELSHSDDPFRLVGMSEAVARLEQAIAGREPIAVYGDYDADGVTATALLVELLRGLGAQVRHYLPHRERDGYGLHAGALADLAASGVQLVVTVDCGIRAREEVARATELGLDLIVTDHHLLPEELPEAVAVVNPRRPDCRYGFHDFAGVGLAFKLAQALLRAGAGGPGVRAAGDVGAAEEQLLDLVALGTVADVVPLVGENRQLVQRGLAVLGRARRPGIRALLASADLAAEALTSRSVAFALGPRLNAAGRMADADTALELLLTKDPAQARALAAELESRNRLRRQVMEQALSEAEARMALRGEEPLLLWDSPSVPLGVIGLVAGRLVDRHHRPAVVVRTDGPLARGSARSVPEFDVTAALSASADLLVRFGGHRRAAGFTLATADLPELGRRLAERAEAELAGQDLRPLLELDAEVVGEDIDWPLYRALGALEPTGEGNGPALLLARALRVAMARPVGNGHLKLSFAGGPAGAPLDGIAFGQAHRLAELGPAADVAFQLRPNSWNGQVQLELQVLDLAPPSMAPR